MKFEFNWLLKLRENNGRKNALVAQVVCFLMLEFETSSEVLKSIQIFFVRNYFFLKSYITSEGVASQNVLFYQQLSIACYQESFYANIYFE